MEIANIDNARVCSWTNSDSFYIVSTVVTTDATDFFSESKNTTLSKASLDNRGKITMKSVLEEEVLDISLLQYIDEKSIIFATDNSTKIVVLNTETKHQEELSVDASILSLKFIETKSGIQIVFITSKNVGLVSYEDGKFSEIITGSQSGSQLTAVAFSRQNSFITGNSNGILQFWVLQNDTLKAMVNRRYCVKHRTDPICSIVPVPGTNMTTFAFTQNKSLCAIDFFQVPVNKNGEISDAAVEGFFEEEFETTIGEVSLSANHSFASVVGDNEMVYVLRLNIGEREKQVQTAKGPQVISQYTISRSGDINEVPGSEFAIWGQSENYKGCILTTKDGDVSVMEIIDTSVYVPAKIKKSYDLLHHGGDINSSKCISDAAITISQKDQAAHELNDAAYKLRETIEDENFIEDVIDGKEPREITEKDDSETVALLTIAAIKSDDKRKASLELIGMYHEPEDINVEDCEEREEADETILEIANAAIAGSTAYALSHAVATKKWASAFVLAYNAGPKYMDIVEKAYLAQCSTIENSAIELFKAKSDTEKISSWIDTSSDEYSKIAAIFGHAEDSDIPLLAAQALEQVNNDSSRIILSLCARNLDWIIADWSKNMDDSIECLTELVKNIVALVKSLKIKEVTGLAADVLNHFNNLLQASKSADYNFFTSFIRISPSATESLSPSAIAATAAPTQPSTIPSIVQPTIAPVKIPTTINQTSELPPQNARPPTADSRLPPTNHNVSFNRNSMPAQNVPKPQVALPPINPVGAKRPTISGLNSFGAPASSSPYSLASAPVSVPPTAQQTSYAPKTAPVVPVPQPNVPSFSATPMPIPISTQSINTAMPVAPVIASPVINHVPVVNQPPMKEQTPTPAPQALTYEDKILAHPNNCQKIKQLAVSSIEQFEDPKRESVFKAIMKVLDAKECSDSNEELVQFFNIFIKQKKIDPQYIAEHFKGGFQFRMRVFTKL